KREVFGMPIPGSLITSDIQEASYYQEYLAKGAKHQRYLAGETGGDPDSPAPKPTKTARKPKPTAPKADPRPSVSKPVLTKQPEPKFALAKTQGKKCKLTTEITDKPSKAMKSRPGLVSKTHKPLSSLRSVDETVAEDVPEKESKVDDEEADVPGKGKEKVIEEQVARDLLNLQTPKKKSPADRYIFQRRTSIPTGSSRHNESSSLYAELGLTNSEEESKEDKSPADRYIFQRRTSIPTGSSGHNESSSLYAELGLTKSEEESKEDMPGADTGGQGEGRAGPDLGAQAKGQAGPDSGAQDEGQDGSNPDEQPESHAGPDPGNAKTSQPMPSHVVYAGLDHEHMDLDVADVLTQPPPEQIDEGFTSTAYPKVQENLKLTVEEQVLLEEPASSSGTLSSL
nr:hypothetical protein [Tanacetum cinerariifolium]